MRLLVSIAIILSLAACAKKPPAAASPHAPRPPVYNGGYSYPLPEPPPAPVISPAVEPTVPVQPTSSAWPRVVRARRITKRTMQTTASVSSPRVPAIVQPASHVRPVTNIAPVAATAAFPGVVGTQAMCPAMGRPASAQDCQLVTQQKASLVNGAGRLRVPPTMLRGERATVRFSITPSEDGGTIARAETLEGDARIITSPVRISSVMSATLVGSAFKIDPTGELVQDLGASQKADWVWTVTALAKGEHPLMLTVKAKAIGSDGKTSQIDLFSDESRVRVDVSTANLIGDGLTEYTGLFADATATVKGLTALLLALGALFGALKFWKRNNKPMA